MFVRSMLGVKAPCFRLAYRRRGLSLVALVDNHVAR